jgi:hypothetical protein
VENRSDTEVEAVSSPGIVTKDPNIGSMTSGDDRAPAS